MEPDAWDDQMTVQSSENLEATVLSSCFGFARPAADSFAAKISRMAEARRLKRLLPKILTDLDELLTCDSLLYAL
jgi:hypothetical protein